MTTTEDYFRAMTDELSPVLATIADAERALQVAADSIRVVLQRMEIDKTIYKAAVVKRDPGPAPTVVILEIIYTRKFGYNPARRTLRFPIAPLDSV